jgi:hypothetical protein
VLHANLTMHISNDQRNIVALVESVDGSYKSQCV